MVKKFCVKWRSRRNSSTYEQSQTSRWLGSSFIPDGSALSRHAQRSLEEKATSVPHNYKSGKDKAKIAISPTTCLVIPICGDQVQSLWQGCRTNILQSAAKQNSTDR